MSMIRQVCVSGLICTWTNWSYPCVLIHRKKGTTMDRVWINAEFIKIESLKKLEPWWSLVYSKLHKLVLFGGNLFDNKFSIFHCIYPLFDWDGTLTKENSWQKIIQFWKKCYRQRQNTLTEYYELTITCTYMLGLIYVLICFGMSNNLILKFFIQSSND